MDGVENSAYVLDLQSAILSAKDGILVTTKLQNLEAEDELENDDNEDKNNAGFDKLPGKGNPVGLFILKIHNRLFEIIEKEKVRQLL